MNREFFVNILFLIVVNALIKPFYIFGIDRAVQNRVGEPIYGLYFALFSFTFLFQIINDFGIQNFNSREISQHRHLLDKYVSSILSLKVVLGLLYLLVAVGITAFIPRYWAVLPLVLHLALYNILTSLRNYLTSNIAALGLYRLNSWLSVLDKILMIIICGILLWIEPFKSYFTIEWFIYTQNATLLITVIVALMIVFKHIQTFKWLFKRAVFLSILRKSMPYALAIFLMTIYTRTDAVMIERLLPDGDRQAGIYASAYRLLDAVNTVGLLFAGLLMPMFSRQIQEKTDITPLFRFSFNLIMVAALTVASSVWHFRTEIMQVLYKQATPFSGDVLGILMGSFVAVSGTYIVSTLIGAAGQVGRMNTIFISAFFINIALNFILIQEYNALGAAISTCITQFFVLISLIFLSKKLDLLRGSFKWILRSIVFGILSFSSSFMIKSHYFTDNWLIKIGLSILICGLLAVVMGFLNYKKIKTTIV